MPCVFSVLDMFSVGVGPSSSHTVGPMLATQRFSKALADGHLLARVTRVHVTLYGSLALTGLGHGTDRAAVVGLENNEPKMVDTDYLARIHEICDERGTLNLNGEHEIAFEYGRDVEFDHWRRFAAHPNGMRFTAYDEHGEQLLEQVWYSIGGGFIQRGLATDPLVPIHAEIPPAVQRDSEEQMSEQTALSVEGDSMAGLPYPFSTASELIDICVRTDLGIDEVVWANETAIRPAEQIDRHIETVFRTMCDCIHEGCTSRQAVLPGGLNVPRRAPAMYDRLAGSGDLLNQPAADSVRELESSNEAWVDLFALAVNEQNAAGGRIVTAPTNGSAGVIPAVLMYYWHFIANANMAGVKKFLLTASAIGYLIKRNASISGAEVGCQGEVGSACSMAAAGLCAVVGGNPRQVENAAEIGMEHHLGLTCDPIAGLVQIPCIERNAIAANTAISAVRMAMLGDGTHIVTLDQVIKTMKDTGEDMMAKYKETATGGLALNVVEC